MSEELKDKMYQKLSLYSSELEDRIEDLEKLNTTITMENERLINEMKKLEKDNQTLMNSMVTEAHTKETKEIERLNNIKKKAINELFNLKDMIYKPETREINFDIQNKISSIIKILGSDKE